MEMRAYLDYVYGESRQRYDQGLTPLEAAIKIELGPYSDWKSPSRLYVNVERAYREFRGEPPDAPWDTPKTFDNIYRVAKAKRIEVEF